jgi:hypothetical protein
MGAKMIAGIRRWGRVAWVCRVSVTSCIAGIILLVFVAQGRDLFLDFPGTNHGLGDAPHWYDVLPSMIRYALYFGALALLFWALPVHAAARLALDRPEWLTSPYGPRCDPAALDAARAEFETAVVWFPRILGGFSFVAAAIGAIVAAYEVLVGPRAPPEPTRRSRRPYTCCRLPGSARCSCGFRAAGAGGSI